MVPVETIIQQIGTDFIEKVLENLRNSEIVSIGNTAQQLFYIAKLSTLEILVAVIEQMDMALVEANRERKTDGLRIKQRNVSRALLTDLGELRYKRTYFEAKGGERYYLLDYLIGVEAYERLSKELCANLVQHAADKSMEKAAKDVGAAVSRQTINNKVLSLKQVAVDGVRVEQTPKELHIFADEDHVHMRSGRGAIVPLLTVTEGIDTTTNRHKTINAVHFKGYGIKNDNFFENVSSFLNEKYDMDKTERVYVHADGGAWIQAAKDWFPNVRFVMDGYHLQKRLKRIAGLKGAAPYMRSLKKAIEKDDFEQFVRCCARIDAMQDDKGREVLGDNINFIQNNWEAIVLRMKGDVCGSCTEPLVSHVLSARLSRNPLAWSEHGIRQMAMVRVYVKNGGVICASDVRVSRKETDLKSDSEAFKKGFSKYRAYADKQIGAFLKNKIDWSMFERSNTRTGKIDGTRMLIKAYSRVNDTTASS